MNFGMSVNLEEEIDRIIACRDLKGRCTILECVLAAKKLNYLSSNSTIRCIENLIECVEFPSDKYGDLQHNDKEVKTPCRNAFLVCTLLEKILSQDVGEIKENVRSLLPLMLFLCPSLLNSINPWIDKNCNQLSGQLMHKVLDACGFSDIKSAIDEESWIFENTFDKIAKNLFGEAWKDSSMARHAFIFLVTKTGGDVLTPSLDKLLPIALNLADDIATRHAVNGIKCIRHILEEVPPAELRYRGRINVLHDALFKKIYSRVAAVLEELLPSILLSLRCLETEMMQKRGCRVPKHDECFDATLTNFHLSSEVNVKRAYAKSLPKFVFRLGIQVIGHMKMICIVLEYGFETADLITIGYLCKMIEELINAAWLRITNYSERLMELLVKTLHSIETDHWRTCYAIQDEVVSVTSSIIQAMARLAAISKELVMGTIALMESEESLGLKDRAAELRAVITSQGFGN